eukprot:276395_1
MMIASCKWLSLMLYATLHQYIIAKTVNVTIDWNTEIGSNQLYATLQVPVVPLLLRSSRIHNTVFSNLKALNADFVRLLFFWEYPSMQIAQLEPPSDKYYCKHLNGNDNSNNWNLTIQCPSSHNNAVINDIYFASFGSPTGSCGNFSIGACHSTNTLETVNNICKGKNKCIIPVNNKTFDISNNVNCDNLMYKSFSIQLTCDIDYYKYSNWDFTYLDEFMKDFYAAVNPNKKKNKTILDFGIYPNWKYKNVSYGAGLIDNPY